ncbi:hypothetical protein BKA62DRAFT_246218 [Auriculariales sp. MPI-PUGE-AT-0066]|nr:hypothetical protein BKA62DRAFT_246218 [Auriculariales sp. MPI-PUGE-AT-0066]
MSYFQRAQSAAIPIIAPSAVAATSASHPASSPSSPVPFAQRSSAKKDSGQKHCRNVLIYGSCKYEGKGCTYYHPPVCHLWQSRILFQLLINDMDMFRQRYPRRH